MQAALRLFLAFLFIVATRGQTNLVPATISSDIVLSGTNLVQGTVTVESNVVVRIEPGARILLDAGATLVVRGTLLAEGSEIEPIHFTRAGVGQRWRGIRFIKAQTSTFKHCLFEYAESAGSHLDYYDDDCDENTPPPGRNYHEAVVAIASRLELEDCLFQNLPDSTGGREGDAIAIISDDPQNPGAASAHINRSRFIGIGQGIHSRFSHILVENSFFTGHNGDNDDIDMYGESTPPPLIRSNIFLNPNHDDMINPTRCSAVIVGNIVSGGDDHGIVLRDECSPVVMNNFILNCANGGISVQNQCDALIANNTIVNCGRGIRLFDHDGRWDAPYCLSPGSGRATVVNTIIWNCDESLTLVDSPFTGDRGSHVSVIYSNIEGGQASASVSANSTLSWENGNLSVDPIFDSDFHLEAGSPMVDAGTNLVHEFARALDGDGDGTAVLDIGADEFLLATADSNLDGIPDGWLDQFGIDPLDTSVGARDLDGDGHTTAEEWVAQTNPTNAVSVLAVGLSLPLQIISVQSFSNRVYTVEYSTNLLTGTWISQPSITNQQGIVNLPMLPTNKMTFFRVRAALPSSR